MSEMYSRENYISVLQILIENKYTCSSFCDRNPAERTLFLRHDIDWSLEWALEFAEIDSSYGFRSTFAFLIRGQSYNLLEEKNKELIKKIKALGHFITLHYPAPKETVRTEEIKKSVLKDFNILEEEIGGCNRAFAWHNTTPFIMSITPDFEIPSLTNIYNKRFTKDIPYRSDSNMRNSIDQLKEIISEKHNELHLLLHPYMWLSEGDSLLEKMLDTMKKLWVEADQLGLENRDYRLAFPSGVGKNHFDELTIKALNRAKAE